MIDPHVHLRDWNLSAKETLAHGLLVAERSGFTAVIDMPNTDPPLTTKARIIKRIEAANRTKRNVSYHLWAGVTGDPAQIDEVVKSCEELFPSVVGLKLFAGHSTGNMGLVEEEIQGRVYRHLARRNYTGAVALHCEKEALLRPELYDNADLSTQSLARPPEAEVASIRDQLSFSKEAGFAGHLHIAHLSTIEGLLLVEEAKREGRRISCGVTPHHLLLNRDMAKDRRLYAKMNPPLRDEETRKKLFEALLEGRIDWVESDHAPHTIADKETGASGIPGFSGMLLLLKVLYEHGLSRGMMQSLFGGNVQGTLKLPPREIVLPSYEALPPLIAAASGEYPYDSFRGLFQS
ncbi:MAG: dihydroorotase [Sphaerochaeta sp.]|jgi:dihydroorotase